MICIIGVGSVGKNLLDILCKNVKYEQICIIDEDIVTQYNVQYDKKYINKYKVEACESQHGKRIVGVKKYVVNDKLTPEIKNIFNKSKIIFDCRDIFENRNSFDAIKLYINKDKLIVDFRKTIVYNYDFEGEYVNYINNTFIKTLISKFVKFYINNTDKIDLYKAENKAISLNTLGNIQPLTPTNSIQNKEVFDTITKQYHKGKFNKIHVEVFDGPYQTYEENFVVEQENKLKNILSNIDSQIKHFPAINIIFSLNTNTGLNMCIYNQTGGA